MGAQTRIARPNPARPPKQILTDDVPSVALSAALADMRKGEFIEYASVEAIRADVEHHKRKTGSR